ncbi:MAG: hypothetical protein HY865_22675 [Chloroflexi bacterium]|nr:hypothetical protein [Chloroflexota bacterium]
MARHSIPIKNYLEVAQNFHWAERRHFEMWFRGFTTKPDRRTPVVLKRLTDRGKLRALYNGKKLIYSVPRRTKGLDYLELKDLHISKKIHGLACTECLVRFYRSEMNGEIVGERHFYGFGSIPEWGIKYPNGMMLLLEFCTKDNFGRVKVMRDKLTSYKKNLSKIEEKFRSQAVVIFVLDVSRVTVERYVGSLAVAVGSVAVSDPTAPYEGTDSPSPFYFVDYETFLKVPIGEQLTAPIYFWTDGRVYPLRKNV